PALRAFDKPVVESGHESCGIYTKIMLAAGFAETAEDNKNVFFGPLGVLCVLGGASLLLLAPRGRPGHPNMLG
ncbi:MAG: hypothetical protein WB796_03475, partial [Candidatus Sulfotelmatobacter sp.]